MVASATTKIWGSLRRRYVAERQTSSALTRFMPVFLKIMANSAPMRHRIGEGSVEGAARGARVFGVALREGVDVGAFGLAGVLINVPGGAT